MLIKKQTEIFKKYSFLLEVKSITRKNKKKNPNDSYTSQFSYNTEPIKDQILSEMPIYSNFLQRAKNIYASSLIFFFYVNKVLEELTLCCTHHAIWRLNVIIRSNETVVIK